MICSDIGSFDITPVDGTNGIVPVGTTYTWTVDDASNVITGEDAGTGSSISDSDLFNTTSSPADLVYTVTTIYSRRLCWRRLYDYHYGKSRATD